MPQSPVTRGPNNFNDHQYAKQDKRDAGVSGSLALEGKRKPRHMLLHMIRARGRGQEPKASERSAVRT